ncbi:MAG: S8 family peptidase [Bdellovibrionales bacterium]
MTNHLLKVSLTGLCVGAIAWSIQLQLKEDRTPQFSSSKQVPLKLQVVKNTNSKETNVLLNDPAMKFKWGMNGSSKADIYTNKAWNISRGDRKIVVAIIDTGIDKMHPDLKNNLWKNPGETGKDAFGKDKASNGIDDDKNGFIDDVHGWNFVGNDNKLTDNHGHGSHVAGIVGAEGGNNIGISGVSPEVSLMVLKYYDPKVRFNDNLGNTIKAIQYANKMGAHIINYSGGGLEFSRREFNAIKESRDKGILFVAAAGNEASNSDTSNYYPADYNLDNIISVTAVNPNAKVLASSNYGKGSVHIAAPGENIYSTLPGNKYGHMTGTSQATAFVTGVAVLVQANNADFDYLQVTQQILRTADQMPGLKQKTKTSGKLNSYAALAIQPNIALSGAVTENNLSFTASETETNVSPNNNTGLRGLSSLAEVLKKTQELSN